MAPKVSVCIITYNHEGYIVQAIDSALRQKCDFEYEIVIGEDCSTDNTLAICRNYAQQYSDRIRLLHREINLGMMNNFVATLNACEGEYIALLEGDDFWTANDKLARQVEFLEQHPNYSICSHNVNIAYDHQISQDEWLGQNVQTERNLEDLLKGSGGATCSLVFRKNVLLPVPDWYTKQKGGDWSLQVLCASRGDMHYFPDVMGVYRRHAQGAVYYQSLDAKKRREDQIAIPSKNSLQICDALDRHFNYQYKQIIDRQRAYWYWVGALDYSDHDARKRFRFLVNALKIIPIKEWKDLPNFRRGIVQIFFGRSMSTLRSLVSTPRKIIQKIKN
jgi:glycosyltransferase involved in cell wall biosynthesis